MVQDGSFSVPSGASSAEISRTIRDPTDRESAVSAVNTHLTTRRQREKQVEGEAAS
jgi:hypothetical protein